MQSNGKMAGIAGAGVIVLACCGSSQAISDTAGERWGFDRQYAKIEGIVEQQVTGLNRRGARSPKHERRRNVLGRGQRNLSSLEVRLETCYARVFVPSTCEGVSTIDAKATADEKKKTIPVQYQEVTERMEVVEGHLAWRAILCESNTTGKVVAKLQIALRKAGFNPGPIDGRLGHQTLTAVHGYQRQQGIAKGPLTMETLRKLNVM